MGRGRLPRPGRARRRLAHWLGTRRAHPAVGAVPRRGRHGRADELAAHHGGRRHLEALVTDRCRPDTTAAHHHHHRGVDDGQAAGDERATADLAQPHADTFAVLEPVS